MGVTSGTYEQGFWSVGAGMMIARNFLLFCSLLSNIENIVQFVLCRIQIDKKNFLLIWFNENKVNNMTFRMIAFYPFKLKAFQKTLNCIINKILQAVLICAEI